MRTEDSSEKLQIVCPAFESNVLLGVGEADEVRDACEDGPV